MTDRLCDLPIIVLAPVAGVLFLVCWAMDRRGGRL